MFKAIAVFATLALAGFASASLLEVSAIKGLVAAPAAPAPLAVPRAVDVPAAPCVDTDEVPKVELPEAKVPGKREGLVTLPDIVNTLITGLEPVLDDLKGTVAVKVDVDVAHVEDLLAKVVILLQKALDTVNAIASNPSGVIDTVHSLPALAALIKTLLVLVATILKLILDTSNITSTTALTHLDTIKTLLAEILKVVFTLVPGLLALVQSLIGDLVQLLVQLNIASVLNVLGLPLQIL